MNSLYLSFLFSIHSSVFNTIQIFKSVLFLIESISPCLRRGIMNGFIIVETRSLSLLSTINNLSLLWFWLLSIITILHSITLHSLIINSSLHSVLNSNMTLIISSLDQKRIQSYELENELIGWSDIFYVDSRDVNSVSMLFEEMFWELFLEMAVPMVLNCLKAESIPFCNHGCNKTTLSYHLHPVKFSVNENRIRCIHRIVTGDSKWIWECLLKSLIMACEYIGNKEIHITHLIRLCFSVFNNCTS